MRQRTGRSRVRAALTALVLAVGTLVFVSAPAGAAGSVTISSSSGASLIEGASTTITVTRTTDVTVPETITWTITGNTGDLSTAATGDLVFPVGVLPPQELTFGITASDDAIGEIGESITVTLTSTDATTSLPAPLVISLVDDVTGDTGSIRFAAASTGVEETDTVGNTVEVFLERFDGSEGTVSVTPTGTNADITVPAGLITWGPGDSTNKSLIVTVVGDNLAEGPTPEPHSVGLTATLGTPLATPSSHTINITDEVPVGVTDGPYATDEDVALNTSVPPPGPPPPSVLANDTPGEGGSITATNVTQPSHGTVALQSDGHFVYTPVANYSGPDSFTYRVADPAVPPSLSTPVTVNITVNQVNDPPVAVTDSYQVNEDSDLIRVADVGVRSNDSDVEDATTALVVDTTPVVNVTRGTLSLGSDGSFIYRPNTNYSGPDSFTYRLTDTGGLSTTAVVNITVNDFNTPPVAEPDEFFDVPRNASIALPVLTHGTPDSDQDGDVLEVTGADPTSAEGGTVSCPTTTTCLYTPPTDYLGVDSFNYTVSDGNGGSDQGLVTLFVGMPSDCTQRGNDLTGTDGVDVLCGTGGNDTINGLGGNDVILGFGGNDTINGGPGADTISGGGGTDTVTHDATSASESIAVSDDAVGGDAIVEVEKVVENALGGGDSVTVVPSPTTAFDVRGGSGTDTLTYQTGGVTNVVNTGTKFTATGVEDVLYSGFELVRTNEGLSVFGGDGADTTEVFDAPVGGLLIDLAGGGDRAVVHLGALAGPVEVTDSGTSGSDTLVVLGRSGAEIIDVTKTGVASSGEEISYESIERLEIDSAAGDDTIRMDLGAGAVLPAAVPLPSTVVVAGGSGTDVLFLDYPQSCVIDQAASPVKITLDDGTIVLLASSLEGADVTCAGDRQVVSSASGYWMARSSGGTYAYGEVHWYSHVLGGDPVAALDNHPANIGIWVVESDGTVHAQGRSRFFGDVDHLTLNAPIVSMASSRTGDGYHLLGQDGGVFSFGDARFYGSTGNLTLNRPVVSMASNPAGEGYWFVGDDGGIFTFGPETGYHGSVPEALPGVTLNQPVVGMTPTASGNGYWLVARDGGIFAFGDARFYGSVPGVLAPGVSLNEPIVGIVASPTGKGYWIVARDGGVFAFGDAAFYDSLGGQGVTDVVGFAG